MLESWPERTGWWQLKLGSIGATQLVSIGKRSCSRGDCHVCLVAAVFASFSAVWAENRVSNLVSNFMSNLGVEWCVDFNVWLYFYM